MRGRGLKAGKGWHWNLNQGGTLLQRKIELPTKLLSVSLIALIWNCCIGSIDETVCVGCVFVRCVHECGGNRGEECR